MRRDDAPSLGEPDPALHLRTDLRARRGAAELGAGDGEIAPEVVIPVLRNVRSRRSGERAARNALLCAWPYGFSATP